MITNALTNDRSAMREKLQALEAEVRALPEAEPVVEAPPLAPASAPKIVDAHSVHWGHRALAMPLAVVALAVAGVGLWVDVSFLAGFGRDSASGQAFGTLGFAVDIATLILPSVGFALWKARRYALSAILCPVYSISVLMTLLASIGFASVNIGQTVSERSATINVRTRIEQTITRLGAERARPFIPTSKIAVDAAQAGVAAECKKRGDFCRAREADLAKALANEALTERADKVDAELAAAEAELKTLPAFGVADAQASGLSSLVTWLSRGTIALDFHDVEMARVLGLIATIVSPGLLLAFAAGLWSSKKVHPHVGEE